MDEDTFRKRAKRIRAVGEVLKNLPAEVRSTAFQLFEEYIVESSDDAPVQPKRTKAQSSPKGTAVVTMEELFASSDHKKPADNVKLIAAYHYRQFGTEPFSLEDIRKIASDVGITIPERINMTLESAQTKGKKLFARTGTAKYKVTVHGEAYLKSTYGVSKGNKKPVLETEK
jgi:hypothetical protein